MVWIRNKTSHFKRFLMKSLNIITPVSRIDNLPLLHDNISYYATNVKNIWWVILDNSLKADYKNISLNGNSHLKIKLLISPFAKCPGGHAHRNLILDLLEEKKEEWVYNLDDDNILHPDFQAKTHIKFEGIED